MNIGKKMRFPLTGTIQQAQLTLIIEQEEEIGSMIYRKAELKTFRPLIPKNPFSSFKNKIIPFVDCFVDHKFL